MLFWMARPIWGFCCQKALFFLTWTIVPGSNEHSNDAWQIPGCGLKVAHVWKVNVKTFQRLCWHIYKSFAHLVIQGYN